MNLSSWIKHLLSSRFQMKDWDKAGLCLSFELYRDRANRTLTLRQSRYATKSHRATWLPTAESYRKPLETKLHYLISADGESIEEPYCKMIDSLMYMMVGMRPNMAFSGGLLSKFVENSCSTHLQPLKRVLRYCLGTKNAAFVIGDTSNS